ncbi:TonB-dependent receptor [Sinomicrobium kalidii]|uniref:SusC/RagA family TonB-linked outer membrane protein n=1 Tax=Sinomicrobium kalidii TaxID=2900738 RepID=UPI001E3710AB|nr:TonB-dependent receptor [Sinomicrobium kalidii]UGU15662.1 TonB-dependent receptor [Sinomicrobium kalidii]
MYQKLLRSGSIKWLCIAVFVAFTSVLTAQETEINGRVLDDEGVPLPGAAVVEKGGSNGTMTDMDGEFSLTVSGPEDVVLVISFIGFKTQEVPVNDDLFTEVTLQADIASLDEVVVVGYGTQKKKEVTAAISNIKSEDLVRSSSTTTAGALAGKTPGVSVRAKDARPGRGAAIEVRNMGNPLFVIDGIPYGGQTGGDWVQSPNVSGNDIFNSLNLEDIESITILKDASAAIYGMRAANGVVLVTTKKGRKNEDVRINVNGYYGWQNLTRFPKLANAAQYTRGLVEAAQNAGQDPNSVYTPEELARWQAGTEPGYRSYDYYDLVMRKNIPQYHINANVTGGSEKTNYYLSVANTHQDALMEDFSYERTNLQANLESDITKHLSIGTQISGRQEKTRDVGLPGGDGYFSAILGMFSNIPTVGPYANDNPDYINHTRDYSRNPALFDRDIAGYKDNLGRNLNINLFATYDFDFGLKAKGTFSYNYTNNKFDGFQYTYDVYTYNEAEDIYDRTGGVDGGWRFQTEREVVSRYTQFQLDYSKTFGDHSLSVTAAYERSDYEKDYLQLGTNPSNDYLPLLEFDKLNSFNDAWDYEARAGYIGKINYNYKGKYLLELLGRYDASYLYPPGHRWGFFPGVSLGWRISEEPFFKGLKGVVNNLKIRASIGQTGKEEGVSMFGYLGGYTWNNGNAVLDGSFTTGIRPRGLPVDNLSWVKNTNSNIGIDVAMFDNKLSMTADLFKIVRTGVPAPRYDVLLPSEVGYTLPNENLNENGYYGGEGIITYRNSVGELNYTVSGNFTYSRYRSIKTYKPRFGNSWDEYRGSAEDRWGGVWWGYQVVGRFQNEEEIRNHPVNNDGQNNRTQLPGDFIYKDVNGDGTINGMDERPIGYPTGWAPMMSFGGNIGLDWKGIDLNIDFAGGAMQSWFQDYELRNPYHAGGNSPAYLLEDRWHRADPYDPNSEWIPGHYPAIRRGHSGPNARNSDFWLTNVRFLRIRNLELGYTFPKEIAEKISAQKARIYVGGSNLLSFDNVKQYGIDPEIEARAAVVYPQQKTVLVGFNFSF